MTLHMIVRKKEEERKENKGDHVNPMDPFYRRLYNKYACILCFQSCGKY
jgi:hypothetical protein